MADKPVLDERRERLILIQRLWTHLQASRKDPEKYRALVQRIRQEADAFLQTTLHTHDPEH